MQTLNVVKLVCGVKTTINNTNSEYYDALPSKVSVFLHFQASSVYLSRYLLFEFLTFTTFSLSQRVSLFPIPPNILPAPSVKPFSHN